MPIIERLTIVQGVDYTPNPAHRNCTPGKSQWTVSEADEVQVFTYANEKRWLDHMLNQGWGLHYENGVVAYLGVAQDLFNRIFIAKFVQDPAQSCWHGYPADHQRNHQDIPSDDIRKIWLRDGVLPPHYVRRIGKGQPCRL